MAAYMFQRNVLLRHKVSMAFFSFFFPANNNKNMLLSSYSKFDLQNVISSGNSD